MKNNLLINIAHFMDVAPALLEISSVKFVNLYLGLKSNSETCLSRNSMFIS
jgi:hypothetical protein